jgi:hypothetical protein
MPSIRRSLYVCLAVALATATVLAPTAPAAADGVTEPTLDVRNGAGQPASEVAVNDPLAATESAPITQVGQTDQEIESTWDPAQLAVDTSSIVRPEGWDLEYTADGSTWSASVPSPATSIRGVRSSGSVASNGLAGSLQVSTATGTGSLQAGAGSFSGSSGGDGWDAFVVGNDVLNVWHHNGSYSLDCHDKSAGTSCGSVYTVSGYWTGPGSSGTPIGTNVYSLVGKPSTSQYGILCTDVSAVPFSSCGFTPLLTSSGGFDLYQMGTQSLSGTKIYAPVTDNGGKLLCFDTSTSSACRTRTPSRGGPASPCPARGSGRSPTTAT